MSAVLANTAILAELGEDERASLLEFLEARRIEEGGTLFHPGDESSEMYVVVDGAIRIEVDGTEAVRVGPGGVLGALSLVKAGGRRCAAVAAETSSLLVLSRASYFRLRLDHPALALTLQEGIVREVSGDLQALLERA